MAAEAHAAQAAAVAARLGDADADVRKAAAEAMECMLGVVQAEHLASQDVRQLGRKAVHWLAEHGAVVWMRALMHQGWLDGAVDAAHIAEASTNAASVAWARTRGVYAGRYRLRTAARPAAGQGSGEFGFRAPASSYYESRTSTVHIADDQGSQPPAKVAVKVVRRRRDFDCEMRGRKRFDPRFVVPVLEHHALDGHGQEVLHAVSNATAEERAGEQEWVIVMPLAKDSLHDIIAKQHREPEDRAGLGPTRLASQRSCLLTPETRTHPKRTSRGVRGVF